MINFSKLIESDFELLHKWLMTDHVRKWWDSNVNWTMSLIHSKYIHYTKGFKILKLKNETITKPMHAYIIKIDDIPIGYIQYYNRYDFPPEQEYDMNFLPKSCAAIDVYIGETAFLHKGFGSAAIKDFAQNFVAKEFTNVLVDPETANHSAINSYRKAGFKIIQETKGITFLLKSLQLSPEL